MFSKKKTVFLPTPCPAAVVVEKNDPEEQVLRLEVVRVAA